LNESGKNAEVKIKVIRGSSDDKFLNNLLANQQNNFAGFPLMIGQFVKKIGDGQGNISSDTYVVPVVYSPNRLKQRVTLKVIRNSPVPYTP